MLNTTLLVKLSVNIDNILNQAKLVANKIITGMRYFNSKIIKENQAIYLITDEAEKVYIELIYKEETMWLVNIYSHNEEDKDILIDTIARDSTFEKVIIIFDSVSNKILNDNYPLLNQLENKLRSEFCCAIMNKGDLDIFSAIQKLNVKEEFRFDSYGIPKNLNTKLQRLGLIDLISYMNEHKIGGEEFKKYSDCFSYCKNMGEFEEFEKILNIDIFKDINKNLKSKDDIKYIRNVICHNNIIDVNVFKNKLEEVKKIYDYLETSYNSNLENIFKDSVGQNKHITMLLSNDNNVLDEHQFKLKFSQVLNVCGFIFENSINHVKVEMIDGVNVGYLLSQSNENGITIKLRYKKDCINKGIYILCIIFDDNVKQDEIAEIRDNLVVKLENNDIIIMNDYVSTQYCNQLYSKINYIENIVRSYIAVFYFFKKLDLNKIGIEQAKSGNVDSTNKNNLLYNCDFIDLRNILENPPESRKVADLINQLRSNLKVRDFQTIEDQLKNISDTNADVGDILKHWEDLYKYRTIVAHNEYISKKEFDQISRILDESLEIVEKIYFNEIGNVFELENKYVSEFKEEFIDSKFQLRIYHRSKTITLKLEGNTYDFQGLGITRLQRLVKGIVENNNEILFSYILTIESISRFITNNIDKIRELLDNESYPQLVNDMIVKLGFTKYANYRVVSSKEDILEEKIGELLKSIENKIRDIEDEVCATNEDKI